MLLLVPGLELLSEELPQVSLGMDQRTGSTSMVDMVTNTKEIHVGLERLQAQGHILYQGLILRIPPTALILMLLEASEVHKLRRVIMANMAIVPKKLVSLVAPQEQGLEHMKVVVIMPVLLQEDQPSLALAHRMRAPLTQRLVQLPKRLAHISQTC